MPCRVAWPSPLTGGLFIVITATSPCTLYSAVMGGLLEGKKERSFACGRF
jgi:hypothetical protein